MAGETSRVSPGSGTRAQGRQAEPGEDVVDRGQSRIGDVGGHVGHTLEATVTQRPGWQELAWDAVLVGATLVEAVSPPVAVAGIALNRLIHTAR
jgi:hypothetical protein